MIPHSNRRRDLTMVSKINLNSYLKRDFEQDDNEINGNFT